MRASKESRVLLGLVVGIIVLLFVPFAWTTKLTCGPAALAAVFLAGRQQRRLRPEASIDERDYLLVTQCLGLLTILGWALFLYFGWPLGPNRRGGSDASTPRFETAHQVSAATFEAPQ